MMLKISTDNELILINNKIILPDNSLAKKILGNVVLASNDITYYCGSPIPFDIAYHYKLQSSGIVELCENVDDINIYIGNFNTYIFIKDNRVYSLKECNLGWYDLILLNITNAKTIVHMCVLYIIFIDVHDNLICHNIRNDKHITIDTNINLFLQYRGRNNFGSKQARLVYIKTDGLVYIAKFKYPNCKIIKKHEIDIVPYKCTASTIIDIDGRVHTILKPTNITDNFVTELMINLRSYTFDDITISYYDNACSVVLHTTDNKFVDVNTGQVIVSDCITEIKTFGKKVNHKR
jgi:hypothetical protein